MITEKLRMAKATLRPDAPHDQLLREIARLYHQLQALPGKAECLSRRRTPAYVALEAQIRAQVDRYRAL